MSALNEMSEIVDEHYNVGRCMTYLGESVHQLSKRELIAALGHAYNEIKRRDNLNDKALSLLSWRTT